MTENVKRVLVSRAHRLQAEQYNNCGDGDVIFQDKRSDITSFALEDFYRSQFLGKMEANERYDCVLELVDPDGDAVEDEQGKYYFEFPSKRSGLSIHRIDKLGNVLEEIPHAKFRRYLEQTTGTRLEQVHGIPTSFPQLEPMILTYELKR